MDITQTYLIAESGVEEDIDLILSEPLQDYVIKKVLDQGLGVGTGIIITLVAGYFSLQFVLKNLGLQKGIDKVSDLWDKQTENLTQISNSMKETTTSLTLSMQQDKETYEEIRFVKGKAEEISRSIQDIRISISKLDEDVRNLSIVMEKASTKLDKLDK